MGNQNVGKTEQNTESKVGIDMKSPWMGLDIVGNKRGGLIEYARKGVFLSRWWLNGLHDSTLLFGLLGGHRRPSCSSLGFRCIGVTLWHAVMGEASAFCKAALG